LAIGLIGSIMSLQQALAASPVLFPLSMSEAGDLVQFVNLSEQAYQSISFLDNRILQPNTPTAVIPWPELSEAAKDLPLRCHFIFHISHAGSTLYSRLLAAHPAFFSIREPGILRLLATEKHRRRLSTFLRLWSRTFRPTQTAVLKATSFVSEIGSDILNTVPDSKAILMYVPAITFLRALLDGAMSDINSQATARLSRIQSRGLLPEVSLGNLSPGELVAMSWLAEMLSLSRIANQFAGRSLWVNFDAFLESPHSKLTEAFGHLGIATDVNPILASEVMGRYAKKPEVNYDANFREKLLKQADDRFGEEIKKGIAWLEAIQDPTASAIIGRALERSI
jgi:hypothetical protein